MRLSTVIVLVGLLGSELVLLPALQAQAIPDVAVTATTGAANLDLDGTGTANTHIVKVADITLSTVNPTGLELRVTSGHLTEEENRTITFQVITVPDNSSAPGANAFTSGDHLYSTSLAGIEGRDVYIKYTTNSVADPGNYSATIQFTVNDNPIF